MTKELTDNDILRRAQTQTLLKIADLVMPWAIPGNIRGPQGISQVQIKNDNVQSLNIKIITENGKLILQVLPRQREPNDEIAVIPAGEELSMSLTNEEVEELPDGPKERQD